MKPGSVAIVGAAETTELGEIPHTSQLELHCDAAHNALEDAALGPGDIDGVATAGESPVAIAHHLGITPTYVDGTSVGGCSFMLHVRHAAAAIREGLCTTVLVTHGESGRSQDARCYEEAAGSPRSSSSRSAQWGRRRSLRSRRCAT